MGYSPWGHRELNTTEPLTHLWHFVIAALADQQSTQRCISLSSS